MKKISKIFSIALLSLTMLAFQSCDKDTGSDGFDFSNSLPPYVALSSTAAKTVKQGSSTKVTFNMRTGLQEAVTVTYNVIGGGLNLNNQTVTIDRNKTTADATINIPAGIIVAPATTATAVLTVVKAVTASGTQLTLGQKNTPATEKVTINITL